MFIKQHDIKALLWILVLYDIKQSQATNKDEKKPVEIENTTLKEERTSPTPKSVESRFFDLGGVMDELFPGFNQGGGIGGNAGLNFPPNSQFYPGVPAQNWYPQTPINQANGWSQNQQPTSQNQRMPPGGSFNQQGQINRPEQYLNQDSFGQYPGNFNGNPINGGSNQNGQAGNFQYSALQPGQPHNLDRGQVSSDNNQYPGQLAYPNQGARNFNNFRPVDEYGFNHPIEQAPSQGQDNNGANVFNNPHYNQPAISQNSRYPNNQGGNFNQQQQNQKNVNRPDQYPNGQFPVNAGVNRPLHQDVPSVMGQFNKYPQQDNTNSDLAQNFNQQGMNINNNGDNPNAQVKEFNLWTNISPQGSDLGPGHQTTSSDQHVDLNNAIRFPDDDDSNGNDNEMTTTLIATRMTTTTGQPDTRSPSTKNAIVGKPVFIPTTAISSSQVTFENSDTATATQKQCVQNCPTSSEYNPVCGTDDVSYFNPGRLVCARNCGIRVFEARRGNCSNVSN